jgi:hypothetical protein
MKPRCHRPKAPTFLRSTYPLCASAEAGGISGAFALPLVHDLFFPADRRIRAQDSTAIPAIIPARKKSSAINARDASKCEDRNEMETLAAFCAEKTATTPIAMTIRIMETMFPSLFLI